MANSAFDSAQPEIVQIQELHANGDKDEAIEKLVAVICGNANEHVRQKAMELFNTYVPSVSLEVQTISKKNAPVMSSHSRVVSAGIPKKDFGAKETWKKKFPCPLSTHIRTFLSCGQTGMFDMPAEAMVTLEKVGEMARRISKEERLMKVRSLLYYAETTMLPFRGRGRVLTALITVFYANDLIDSDEALALQRTTARWDGETGRQT